MTTFLLATDNVHEAAALCNYLEGRLESDDVVQAVGVSVEQPAGASFRDQADALNAVRARLGAVATVETEPLDGAETESLDGDDPVALLLDRARSVDSDEVVVGDASLARQLIAAADRPVVVVNSGS